MTLDGLSVFSLVYLATPYTKYPLGLELAFRDASALAAKLMQEKVNVYSPIAHTHPLAIYGGIDPTNHAIWLQFDEAIMKKSDALLVAKMPTWDASFGIAHEISVFRHARKPIFYLDPDAMTVCDE